MNKAEHARVQELARHLVFKLSLALRRANSKEIGEMFTLLGMADDPVEDRRHATWREDGAGRKTVAARPTVQVEWRGEQPHKTSVQEAAKLVGRGYTSLLATLSKGKGVARYEVPSADGFGTETVTVRRIEWKTQAELRVLRGENPRGPRSR